MRASLWPTRPLNGWKGGRWRERNGGGGGGGGGVEGELWCREVFKIIMRHKISEMHLGNTRETGCLFHATMSGLQRPLPSASPLKPP